MNMRKAFLFIALVSLVLVSCKVEVQPEDFAHPEGTVKVTVDFTSETVEKNLYYDFDDMVVTFEYQATPYFAPEQQYDQTHNNTFGVCTWREFTPFFIGGVTYRCTLGYFSQGYWHFDIRGLNSSGVVLVTDHCDIMLSGAQDNFISMKLLNRGEGDPSGFIVDIQTPALEGEQSEYYMRCYTTKISYNNGQMITEGTRTLANLQWTAQRNNDNSMHFYSESPMTYEGGTYLVETELIGPSGIHIAGQNVLMPFTPGHPATIRGRLEGGAFIFVTFVITEDRTEPLGYIEYRNPISVSPSSNTDYIYTVKDRNTVLRFVRTGGSVSSVMWYVDGDYAFTGTEFTFNSGFCGQHEVSAIVHNASGEKTGYAQMLVITQLAEDYE